MPQISLHNHGRPQLLWKGGGGGGTMWARGAGGGGRCRPGEGAGGGAPPAQLRGMGECWKLPHRGLGLRPRNQRFLRSKTPKTTGGLLRLK